MVLAPVCTGETVRVNSRKAGSPRTAVTLTASSAPPVTAQASTGQTFL
jgi:hypothetical protein